MEWITVFARGGAIFLLAIVGCACSPGLPLPLTNPAPVPREFVPYRQPVRSMAPAIVPGEFVYFDMDHYQQHSPKVGDVALYRFEDESAGRAKRIVALGPTRFEMRDGRLLLDGRVAPEPYVAEGNATGEYSTDWGPIDLPEGCVYFLGDNRDSSDDSRNHGCYAREDLLGIAKYVSSSDRAHVREIR